MEMIELSAARRDGTLASLGADFPTPERLTVRNASGNTPLHHAAIVGHLDQIPAALLTADTLSVRSNAGITVFHLAAAHGSFHQIPPPFFFRGHRSPPDRCWQHAAS
jgi:hypothetical protein